MVVLVGCRRLEARDVRSFKRSHADELPMANRSPVHSHCNVVAIAMIKINTRNRAAPRRT